MHSRMPFHRISQWTGGFFEDTSLTKIGLEIHLGHAGQPCPGLTDEWCDTDDEGDHLTDGPWIPLVNDPQTTTGGGHVGAPLPDQILSMAFTFVVLDDFLLDNLECGTSAMNYYSKLRRVTSSVFPHLVPDRYRELMRVGRQWKQVKQLKWHGFGHEKRKPKAGELALFCPACPQPGVNVNLSDRNGSDPAWLYSRSLVMDGNFKAEHLYPANPTDEVALTDGLGFMVGDARYKMHLAEAQDTVQRSDCNNHRAVNQANASRHKLEATGIGGCACTRHGCFVPHSMVDFQKGERQMNMDYALCQALGYNTDGIDRALTFYDINCQYHKHLNRRIEESPYLDLPWGMEIVPGIGLWHVHGHQDKCYVRYTSNFITGAARIDGEIMETLWAPLNIISPVGERDVHPSPKGMIRMSKFLCRKFKEAVQGVQDSRYAFDRLTETADDDTLAKWEAEAAAAQDDRLHNPGAMDIYEVQLTKAPTRKQQELHLLNRQAQWPAGEIHRGAATWLASGITLEEAQVALLIDVKKLGKRPTDTQKLAIARRRHKWQDQLDEFVRVAGTFLGDQFDSYDQLDGMTVMLDTAALDSVGSSSDDPDRSDEEEFDIPVEFNPETVVIPLPSNIGITRVNLADKAVLFRTTVRSAKSQARSTRAWARVHSVDKVLHLNTQIYSKCRKQLVHLGADDLLTKYRPLEKADLKATTVVADPNARGQRNSTLAWFWSIDVQGDSTSNDWMNEFYRVHWLRTLALRDRWAEELLLVGREMIWTVEFFIHKSQQWVGRLQEADANDMVGHQLLCSAPGSDVSPTLTACTRQFRKNKRGGSGGGVTEVHAHAFGQWQAHSGLVTSTMPIRIKLVIPLRSKLQLVPAPPIMSNSTTLFTYELNDFTAWDAANVLEYATSRFSRDLACMRPEPCASGRRLTKPALSGTFNGRQITINAEELHDEFFECCSPNDQELWSNHRVVRNYSHDWWKDRFDRLGFELPMLTIQEPIGAMLMPGPAVTGQVDGDALFNQIVAVRAHLRHLGEAMASLLEQKTQIAAAACLHHIPT
ncbi:uncharacterized protein EDB91DRAFT_1090173 [Suillus paluster]|uniref:uncharacterized protein n=1 Tax=Suillus paluster TaxID=48578 RepID=UPI001B87AA7E|nr:uncharacterized protein EDB91DRAFT_1090173 [Suillus paluster]KAG1718273.1 hypothetical protein EDB91DRAFT_1090173 [Suillus paluster]